MAQRDYISNKPKVIRSSQRRTKEKRAQAHSPKILIALVILIVAVFLGGLYFIMGNAPKDQVEQQRTPTESQLPPPPQERWQYIRNLESNSNPVDNAISPNLENSEQAGLDALIQHQISQQSGTTNSLAGSNQDPALQNQQLIQATEQLQQAQLPNQQLPNEPLPNGQQTPSIYEQNTTTRIRNDELITNAQTPIEPSVQTIVTDEAEKQAKIAQEAQQKKLLEEKARKQENEIKIAEAKKQEIAKKEAQKLAEQNKQNMNRWQLQCGSFQSNSQAEEVRAKLAFSGIESRILKAGEWNRVMLGPFSNRNAASDMMQKVKSAGVGSCLILAP